MLRRLCGGTVLAGLLLVGGWAGPARTDDKTTQAKVAKAAPYVHAGVFHLKPDAPAGEAEAMIADAQQLLAKIPTVRDLRVGRPAEKGSPGAKKDFQVGLLVLFDDYPGLQTYLDHPLHIKYVEKHLKHIDANRLL